MEENDYSDLINMRKLSKNFIQIIIDYTINPNYNKSYILIGENQNYYIIKKEINSILNIFIESKNNLEFFQISKNEIISILPYNIIIRNMNCKISQIYNILILNNVIQNQKKITNYKVYKFQNDSSLFDIQLTDLYLLLNPFNESKNKNNKISSEYIAEIKFNFLPKVIKLIEKKIYRNERNIIKEKHPIKCIPIIFKRNDILSKKEKININKSYDDISKKLYKKKIIKNQFHNLKESTNLFTSSTAESTECKSKDNQKIQKIYFNEKLLSDITEFDFGEDESIKRGPRINKNQSKIINKLKHIDLDDDLDI